MLKTLSTPEKARILAGQLITTQSCADEVESDAFYEAKTEIAEVLDLLVEVDTISEFDKEQAAFLTGQYMFDQLCSAQTQPDTGESVRPIGDCEIINGICAQYGVKPAACIEICDAARFVEESVALVEARRSQNA